MEKVYIRKKSSSWILGKMYHVIAFEKFINSTQDKTDISVSYENNLFQATFYKGENNVHYFIELNQSPTEIMLLEPNKAAFINRVMDV